jgi:hypothetical protein
MFPTPFGENLPPGLDGVVESQALDTATIQDIADRLTIAVREDVSRDKTAVARLKTKMVKPIAGDMRLARADNLTPAAQRMRQAAEISLADDDAEIMRIAPRLNSYLPAEAIPIGGAGFPSPAAPGGVGAPRAQPPIGAGLAPQLPPSFPASGGGAPLGPPNAWGCDGQGYWSYPAGPLPPGPPPGPGVNPAGYPQAWDGGQGAWRWINNRGQLPIQFARCSSSPASSASPAALLSPATRVRAVPRRGSARRQPAARGHLPGRHTARYSDCCDLHCPVAVSGRPLALRIFRLRQEDYRGRAGANGPRGAHRSGRVAGDGVYLDCPRSRGQSRNHRPAVRRQ